MKTFLCLLALAAAAMADSTPQELLKTGNDQFTANMFNEVAKEQEGKSYVLSAFSVLSPLAQLALASEGSSHDELLTAIGLPNDNAVKEAFSSVNAKLRSVKGVVLKQANKVYIRDGYTLNEEFAGVSKEVFDSEVQNIDFSNGVDAAKEINTWVEDHTNKRIKDLVDPDSLDGSTASVLVNAIYFKGAWKYPFEKFSTRDEEFTVSDKNGALTKKAIPMMHQTEYFNYGTSEELDAKILQMPYEGEETSFVAVLPNQVNGIDDLIKKLKDPAAFSNALKNVESVKVAVTLPKFKIETKTNLKEVLTKLNVNQLFSPRYAKLNKLIKEASDLYVSDAVQKAFIEVNEEGAEAAAANAFGIALTSAIINERIEVFKADHPFAFFLLENNNILFNGVYRR